MRTRGGNGRTAARRDRRGRGRPASDRCGEVPRGCGRRGRRRRRVRRLSPPVLRLRVFRAGRARENGCRIAAMRRRWLRARGSAGIVAPHLPGVAQAERSAAIRAVGEYHSDLGVGVRNPSESPCRTELTTTPRLTRLERSLAPDRVAAKYSAAKRSCSSATPRAIRFTFA